MGLLTENLGLNDTVSKGDVLRLEFTFKIPYFKETQIGQLTKEIEKDGRFLVKGSSVVVDRAYLTIEVLKDPLPLLVVVGVITGAGALLFFFLQFEKAERILKAGTTAIADVLTSAQPIVYGVALILALWFLGPALKRITA